ncbi:MAG: hypothetical protein LBG43_02350 [Treponema sp.]|jgi:hypothetical protein|nr:hypothetical protein [Treponema sp.]
MNGGCYDRGGSLTPITRDRCGKDIAREFYGEGGNCARCGDNLCAARAGKWIGGGECEKCGADSYRGVGAEEKSRILRKTRGTL